MLEVTNLCKKYDGFLLGPIDMTLEPGSVHALTVLCATYHVSEIENLADQIIFIRSGRILKHAPLDTLKDNWRRITFRTELDVGDVPNQVARINRPPDYEVTSSSFQSSIWYLEQSGVKSIETTRLSAEQISVHILKSPGPEVLHDERARSHARRH